MYLMNSDLYECDLCGFREKWDAHDAHRGDIWECDICGTHFCSNCFAQKFGMNAFSKMLSETDRVICPSCWSRYSTQEEL